MTCMIDRCGDRPETLSPDDDRFLADLAARVRGAGLAAPALLWLAGMRPLSFLGSQALHVLSPLAEVVAPGGAVGRLAGILETRPHLDRLLAHLEAHDTGGGSGGGAS